MEMDQIIHGEALNILRQLPTNSVDSVVTDPPGGIAFMSKDWDSDKGGRDQWVSWLADIMTEARRVLKPGGHALVWSMPRTSHWTGYALENAGYEIRDTIEHVYGSGFPKSLDVSKTIDKMYNMERKVIGEKARKTGDIRGGQYNRPGLKSATLTTKITAPATPEAEQWAGFGTGLKPAHETWWLARAPLAEDTIAANVLEWGTGAINIDACRIPTQDTLGRDNKPGANGWKNSSGGATRATYDPVAAAGRWPANFLMSHTILCNDDGCAEGCPVAELDRQSGNSKGHKNSKSDQRVQLSPYAGDGPPITLGVRTPGNSYSDQGGASRYFANFYYTPKASRKERNAGCEELPEKAGAKQFNEGMEGKIRSNGTIIKEAIKHNNHHPTVKSISLMRYLTRLVTPPGGLVLDPFAGSGTTGVACVYESFRFIGIEEEAEYVRIARARLVHAKREAA